MPELGVDMPTFGATEVQKTLREIIAKKSKDQHRCERGVASSDKYTCVHCTMKACRKHMISNDRTIYQPQSTAAAGWSRLQESSVQLHRAEPPPCWACLCSMITQQHPKLPAALWISSKLHLERPGLGNGAECWQQKHPEQPSSTHHQLLQILCGTIYPQSALCAAAVCPSSTCKRMCRQSSRSWMTRQSHLWARPQHSVKGTISTSVQQRRAGSYMPQEARCLGILSK